jgi:hypothetical protein
MADEAFSRVVINPRERPLSSDINQFQSEESRTLREVLRALFLPHNVSAGSELTSFLPVSGFLGDGFFVVGQGALTHAIHGGLGFIFDSVSVANDIGAVSKVDDRSPYYPVYLSADQQITSPAAPAPGFERIDIIEVKLDRRLQDNGSRDVLNTGTGVFDPTLVLKSLAYALDGRTGVVTSPTNSTTGIGLKAGVAQATGTYAASNGVTGIPATSPGYTRIAVILVASTGLVTQGEVRDDRLLLAPNGSHLVGFELNQAPGNPNDTFIIVGPVGAAGFKFAAHQVTSPSNGGTVRVYLFGGRISANAGAAVTIHLKAATIANANRLPRATNILGGVVTSAIKTSLAGPGGSTAYTAAVGQEFLTFDMDGTRLIDAADPSDTTRIYDIIAALRMK